MFSRTIHSTFLYVLALSTIGLFATTVSSSDLICHTTDVSECYPKIFQATEEFQPVRDDQDLPPGLHVRLNIQTGYKEAKLYDGKDDDIAEAVEVVQNEYDTEHGDARTGSDVLPLDHIDDEPQGIEAPPAGYSVSAEDDRVPIPPELLQHVLHGGDRTIKRPVNGDADAEAFTSALGTISSPDSHRESILSALMALEDLAHDIYWGSTLAKSASGIQMLASRLHDNDAEISSTVALVLGNTVHNNPKALNLTLTHVPELPKQIQVLLGGKVDGKSLSTLPSRQYTRLLFLLSSLLSGSDETTYLPATNADGLYGLLSSNYLEIILKQFDAPGAGSEDGWERPRQAIADLILDRIVGPDAIKQFTEYEWRIWNGRDGYAGGGLGAAWTRDNLLRSEAEVERRGAADAGWKKVFGGKVDVSPVWVRAPAEDARDALEKSPEPTRYSDTFKKQLVAVCTTFQEALNSWAEQRRGGSGAETAEEHVREAHRAVNARLGEIGCECNGCPGDGGSTWAKEKTEL